MLYPEYENGTKGASGMNTAPYFKVQFMNFISKDRYSKFDINNPHVSGLLVTMDGITATHSVDNGFFQGEDFSLKPKLITLSCNLVVAHEDENDPSWKEFFTDEDQQAEAIEGILAVTGPQNQENANKQKKLNSRKNDITKA